MSRMVVPLAALLLVFASDLSAQCWDCRIQYYSGEQCYMLGCYATFDDGFYNNCSQHGECENEDCSTSGGICTPFPALLDGRGAGGLLDASPLDLLQLEGVVVASSSSRATVFRAECSDAILRVVYDDRYREILRRRTSAITL